MEILWCIIYFMTLIVFALPLRIGEGKEVRDPTQFPFFAMLRVFSRLNSTRNATIICGGSLIHPFWVLTAGHCLPNDMLVFYEIQKSDRYMVFMGDVHVPKRSHPFRQRRKIRKIHRHPQYKGVFDDDGHVKELRYDIAVVKVHKPFKLSKAVQIIPLNFQNCPYVIAIGTGRTGLLKNSTLSSTLKYARLAVNYDYHTVVRRSAFIVQSTIGNVEYEESGYALAGDSGGPIICDGVFPPKQIGVISEENVVESEGEHIVANVVENIIFYRLFMSQFLPSIGHPDHQVKRTKEKRIEAVSNAERQTIHSFTVSFSSMICICIVCSN